MIYDDIYKNDETYNDKVEYKLDLVEDWLNKFKFKTILDVGCGRGHYIRHLKDFNITGIEPSKYVFEHDLKGLQAINGEIKDITGKYDALYCMDVLEHIEELDMLATIDKLAQTSKHALLGIANHNDTWNGTQLHLTQRGIEWWEQMLKTFYKEVNRTFESENYYVFGVSNV